MTSQCDMEHFSALQFNHEEGKERVEEAVRDWQEVARPDVMRVVMQEARPSLRGGPPTSLAHILLNGALGAVYVQFEECAPDALGTPQALMVGQVLSTRPSRERFGGVWKQPWIVASRTSGMLDDASRGAYRAAR